MFVQPEYKPSNQSGIGRSGILECAYGEGTG